MKFPKVKVKTPYTPFKGGIDLESAAMDIYPGALLSGLNYVEGVEGSYERIDGFERYSGQPSPSDATYYLCPCSFTSGGPAAGDTITGVDSGETAVVIVVGSDYVDVTKLSGDFNDDEVFNVGGSPKGTFTGGQIEKAETSGFLHATALNLAADQYRADISAPTGSNSSGKGGLALLDGILYAFLDNAGGTAGLIYKETAAGWVAVTPGNEISFDTGIAEIFDGDTVTQDVSGAFAVVNRVVLESGTWSGNAAGRLILGTITGAFDATNVLKVATATKATSTSLATAITLAPNGRYEVDVFNFTGSTDTKRIYGCDGVNRGFEFDGAHYVPIDTGMTVDTPIHVKSYKNQLFFSFRGSSQNSGIGTPYIWSAVLGATEIAVGDDITNYLVVSETLLMYSRNSLNQLGGDDADTFFLDPVDREMGAIPYTAQNIGRSYALDDRGVIESSRVDQYGNFALSSISTKIQPRINSMQAVAVASSVYRAKNQYRIYGNDGTGICMTVRQGYRGLVYSFTQFLYPVNVACTVTGEDSTGKDIVFFMSDAGMVYQADRGSSFDGEDIEAVLFPAYDNSKSPSVLKTYRKASIEMTAEVYASISISASFNYGDTDIQPHIAEDIPIPGKGGLWDVANWDEFFWDSSVRVSPSLTLEGDAQNVSIGIYSKSDIDLGHKLDGVIIHYTPRRIVR